MSPHDDIELQPDDLEVLQAETDDPGPVARVEIVGIDGPVRTQELPRKASATRSRTVGTTPTRVLTADHRRAVAQIVSVGQNMYVATSAAAAQDPSAMALWPASVPLTLTADTDVWVASATGTTVVSTITENWATGS